jgi:predicted aminopeptidase
VRRSPLPVCFAGPLLLLVACSPAYVARGGYEEARILLRREPIVAMLQQPDVDAATKEKLRLVLIVRDFAARRGLDVGGSYRTYATIGPDQTIFAVSAAPRFALEPYTWWFPFVGRMPYKGYFDEGDARAEARALGQQGYDTIVVPVAAFSTLGWFDDPLLSNLLQHDVVVLAQIVLHELTHNTYYAAGQAAFNESFANFVGGRGAIELFAGLDGENAPRTEQARALWHDDVLYSEFLAQLTARLSAEYAKGITLEQREEIFRQEQERFQAWPWQTDAYRGVATAKLNNAVILQQEIYHRDLPLFEAVYAAEGDDLTAAVAAIIGVSEESGDPYAALASRYRGVAPSEPVGALP